MWWFLRPLCAHTRTSDVPNLDCTAFAVYCWQFPSFVFWFRSKHDVSSIQWEAEHHARTTRNAKRRAQKETSGLKQIKQRLFSLRFLIFLSNNVLLNKRLWNSSHIDVADFCYWPYPPISLNGDSLCLLWPNRKYEKHQWRPVLKLKFAEPYIRPLLGSCIIFKISRSTRSTLWGRP